MRMPSLPYVVCMLSLTLVAAGCATTSTLDPPNSTVTVSGVGRVSIAPDIAMVTLGVNARAATAAEASADAARRMSAVLTRIKSLGVTDADLATVTYSVEPRMSMARSEEPAQVVGYQVLNLVQVTIRKMADASPIVDAAMGAGANVVREIHFTRGDPSPAQGQARALAVSDAMAKARELAAAANVRLGKVLSIRESSAPRPIPVMRSAMVTSGGTTPIESGQLEITVTVELRQAIRR